MSAQQRSLIIALYAEAFARFGHSCLWSKRQCRDPTVQHVRIIARSSRIKGNRDAYELAQRIDEACEAADSAAE